MRASYPSLVCLLILAVAPFSIETDESLSAMQPQFGYDSERGANVTAEEVASFINFVNSASAFYRDDFALKSAYVRQQMNSAFGKPDFAFSFFQIGNAAQFPSTWTMFCEEHFASIDQGQDRVFPDKSYMFARQNFFHSEIINFMRVGEIGHGFYGSDYNHFIHLIERIEANNTQCVCEGLPEIISTQMNNFDLGSWSVICSANAQLKGSVSVWKEIGAYLRPKLCNYIIYRNE